MNSRIFIFCSLTALSLAANFNAFDDNISEHHSNTDLVSLYEKTLENEEINLKTELFTMVDIQEDQWERIKSDTTPLYERTCIETTAEEVSKKPLPKKLIDSSIEVLRNSKIGKLLGVIKVEPDAKDRHLIATCAYVKPIKILRAKNSFDADAATDQFHVLLNPEILLKTHANKSEIKATIAHEIMHIINEDDLEVFCLEKVFQKQKNKKKLCKNFKKLMGQWERFHEKRADLLSGLIGKEYAQAHEKHFKRNMPKRERLKSTDTHPTTRQRHEYMKNLVYRMEEKKQSNGRTNQLSYILAVIAFILIFSILYFLKKKR